jgi:molybdopterin-containing oxidoreductase family iron-sulfur binding subunit
MSGDIRNNQDNSEPFHITRRDWFKTVAGVTIGLSATAASKYDKLIPYLKPNDQVAPGIATWYATSCRECPAGCGMIVRNREGHVVKCEGNPEHPINTGTLCARGQAALHGLYDPDRLRAPRLNGGDPQTTWERAFAEIGRELAALRGAGRVAVISDLQSGSLAELSRRWLKAFGSDRYIVYEPFGYLGLRRANRECFGEDFVPVHDLEHSDFILSFGVDFLETWISPVEYARQFAATRTLQSGKRGEFVYIGPRVSMTAANADERIIVPPDAMSFLAQALARVIIDEKLVPEGAPHVEFPRELPSPEAVSERTGIPAETIRQLARRFAAAKRPVALAGSPKGAWADDIDTANAATVLNMASGTTPHARHALSDITLLHDLSGVDVVIIISGNPLYSESGLRDTLKGAKQIVYLNPYLDETAEAAHWVLPTHTPLESWGDYEPQTGIANLMQPTMGALYDTQTAGDALIGLAKAAGIDPETAFGAGSWYEFLRVRWRDKHHGLGVAGDFEAFWRECLARGGHFGEREAPALKPAPTVTVSSVLAARTKGLQLWAYPSMSLFDGRGANRPWLQELPDPITKVAWSSWIEVSPQDAERLGIERGGLVRLESAKGAVEAPAVVYAGLAPGTVAVPYGGGHTAYGRYALEAAGANAHVLTTPNPPGPPSVEGNGETATAPNPPGPPSLKGSGETATAPNPPGPPSLKGSGETATGNGIVVSLKALGGEALLPCPDGSTSQEGRGIVRTVELEGLAGETPAPREDGFSMPLPEGYVYGKDMYPPHDYPAHRWAMVVDLSRCTGCGACVTACYAENNLPIVGKRVFAQHRDLSWIRIDRYYEWENPHAPVLFQPMLCQHCDAAPCESVCPVFAASHSEEGLNMQVYNRCVGTRYCSNNCPYKVRRFNWFDWKWPEPLNFAANPDVTMRRRGVMEKCSFCIQRIRAVEQQAKTEDRLVRDGEVVPACAQTCPTGVITFGDLMDPNARVTKLIRHDPRRYQVFEELNTKPAVVYLKKIVRQA